MSCGSSRVPTSKNLRTPTPVALTTAWKLVLPERQDRATVTLKNGGGDVVNICLNKQADGATAPDPTTDFYPLASGEVYRFPTGEAPARLWAAAAATTATLYIIEG